MSSRRQTLALEAMNTALRVRRMNQVDPQHPVCVYDLAERLHVDVRFMDVPSIEGVYSKSHGPAIVVSSLRPHGRQAFTCAHELGHHVFGHGDHFDPAQEEWETRNTDHEELCADSFAGMLLMPRSAVSTAFRRRGWSAQTCTAHQVYVVAGWFGVGYTALVSHMAFTLKLISRDHAEQLLTVSPARIRTALAGRNLDGDLVVVDPHWLALDLPDWSVDVQVGDYILVPRGTRLEGSCVAVCEKSERADLVRATAPGSGSLRADTIDGVVRVRVSRHGYVGRAVFRHLEESDDE